MPKNYDCHLNIQQPMSSTLVFILTTVLVLFNDETIPIRELEAKELFLFLTPETDMNISVFLSFGEKN